MGATASVPIYAVQDIPGKGRGLIATKDIPKGMRIISEKPIVTISHPVTDIKQLHLRLHQQVSSLSAAQKREFLSLANAYTDNTSDTIEQWHSIFRTNALPMGPHLDTGGIFPNACRINHACDNNATNFWNATLDQLTIHAVRAIRKGEEITISYLSSLQNRRARQAELLQNFKFACACRLCGLPREQSTTCDAQLDRTYEIDGIIEEGGLEGLVAPARRMLGYVDEQVRLWDALGGNAVGLARAYPDAFQLAVANGDLARARVFAERLVLLYGVSLGEDSPDVSQYRALARDPAAHEYYGRSRKWETRVDGIPQGLEPERFENWLWRRRKDTAQGQGADFRDRETFPGFNDLPDRSDGESDYFDCGDVAVRRPVRHWCFLAEIQDVFSLDPLHMVVEDVDGVIVPVSLRTSSIGLSQSRIQKGHTVAILYAVRHGTSFSRRGIHHEYPQTIKIFRLPLDSLRGLNDKVKQYSTEVNGQRTCHACGKTGTALRRCGKCFFFWYCDQACQKIAWVEKTHSRECKVLQDADWKAMLDLKWDTFDGHVQFPLRTTEGTKLGGEAH